MGIIKEVGYEEIMSKHFDYKIVNDEIANAVKGLEKIMIG